WANHALGSADVILVIGSRLDIRQTGADVAAFKGSREIYHVDCEPGEINNRGKDCHAIHAHLLPFLEAALRCLADRRTEAPLQWMSAIVVPLSRFHETGDMRALSVINPNDALRRLTTVPRCPAGVTDVGQYQLWAAQPCDIKSGS